MAELQLLRFISPGAPAGCQDNGNSGLVPNDIRLRKRQVMPFSLKSI